MDKNAFFSSIQLRREVVEVSGMPVRLRELTAGERGKLIGLAKGDPVKAQAQIVIMGSDDFDDSDEMKLLALPGSVLSLLSETVMRLSGLGDEDHAGNSD